VSASSFLCMNPQDYMRKIFEKNLLQFIARVGI
jgi:hypothetical protein